MNAFTGKIALVTGGAGSVGSAVAGALARQGATVVVNCFHSYAKAKMLVAELKNEGLDVVALRASVAKPDQVQNMMGQVKNDFGRLDVLVNNAAFGQFRGLDDVDEQSFDRVYNTNVKAPLWCVKYARPLLAAAGGGAVVNVSSIGATHAIDDYLLIGSSKAALESMTRYLAVELAPDNIRVNTASAGLINNSAARLFPEPDRFAAKIAAHTPMGRLGTPADLAKVVLFLASTEAGWITGQTVLADGGLLLGPATFPPVPAEQQAITEPNGDDAAPTRTSGPSPTVDVPATPVPGVDHRAAPQAIDRPSPEPGEDVEPVAIVGMGVAVPGASSPAEFWSLLNQGAELFVHPPDDRWLADDFVSTDQEAPDKSYQARSGFITTFSPHPRLDDEDIADDPNVDHNTRWLRHCLYQAMDSTRLRPDDRVNLCLGLSADNSQHLEESVVLHLAVGVLDEVQEQLSEYGANQIRKVLEHHLQGATQDPSAYLPGRIARDAMTGILPRDSRVQIVDAACASSLNAIDLGIKAIRSGRADVAVCGGGESLTPTGTVLFAKLRGLSRTGAVKSLDATADGVLFCDGAGLVVLKSLSRAVADGDDILGLVVGVGLASDGKGKAIYAPSSTGQKLAIDRALTDAGLKPRDVDYIVAHSTGTPAGDSTEVAALSQIYGTERRAWISSNKSLIGHTGWGAGVISVIQLLLALRHEAIPAQFRFRTAAKGLAEESAGNGLTVPRTAVPWAPATRPRTGAVSAFGFGGADAHVLIQEYRRNRPVTRVPRPSSTDRSVVVGWSAHLPGAESTEDALAWLHGRSTSTSRSFGEKYPVPPFQRLRLPGASVRVIDRSQLMLIECMHRLDAQVQALCTTLNDRVGVVVGHVGIVRNAALYKLRVHLDKITRVLSEERIERQEKDLLGDTTHYLRSLRDLADRLQDPPREDSNPGEMPNIIAARLCNYFDLHGLGLTVDNGPDSLAEAFDIAGSYLGQHDLDVALVGTVNGNTLPAWRPHITSVLRSDSAELQEGAFLFAVTREAVAREHELPILAGLDDVKSAALEVDHA